MEKSTKSLVLWPKNKECVEVKNKDGMQFIKNALLYVDANKGYEWGGEDPSGADCSGTVCGPLMMMGWKIRGTADDLYKKIFTNNVMDNKKFSERPMAVFYVSDIPWTKLSGKKMPAGTVRHVTPVVGYNVVLHADYTEDHIRLYDVDAIKEKYHKDNCSVVWREVDWDAVKRYDGRLYYV